MARTTVTTALLGALAALVCAPSLGAGSAGPAPSLTATSPVATSDDPILAEAWQGMRYANHPKALKAFEKALAQAKDEEGRAEATFGLALLWQSRPTGANLPLALRLYQQVIDEFKGTKAAPWALLALARNDDLPDHETDRTEEKVEAARRKYRRILAEWPDHAAADEAAIRLAQTYLEHIGKTEIEDQGAAILRDRLAKRPENPLAAVMHWHLGGLHKNRRQFRQAVDHWGAADRAGIPGTEVRAMLCLAAGYIAETQLKDYDLAISWYEKITKEIVRDNRYYVAKMWADRCRKARQEAGAAKPADPPAREGGP